MIRTIQRSKATRLKFDHDGVLSLKRTSELMRHYLILQATRFEHFVLNAEKYMALSQRVLGSRLTEWIQRKTFYGQFVAGNTFDEIDQNCKLLELSGVKPMLAVPIEENQARKYDESFYDENLDKILNCLKLADQLGSEPRMMQVRITAFVNSDMLLSLSRLAVTPSMVRTFHQALVTCDEGAIAATLSDDDNVDSGSLLRALERLYTFARACKESNVRILIDAEYTTINPALSLFAMALQMELNQNEPVVWNTIQAFLIKSKAAIQNELAIAKENQFHYGVKLVRGAYIEGERALAEQHDWPNPVWASKELTDANYDVIAAELIDEAVDSRLECVLAGHNEHSISLAIDRLNQQPELYNQIRFAQLYGMGDHISMALGSLNNVHVYKSMPYGTVDETLPYIARRAIENRSILAAATRERSILRRELLSSWI